MACCWPGSSIKVLTHTRNPWQGAEPGRVKTYPRNVDGIIRQADSTRAEARARKKQRKQEERQKMESEIQRLKTLKRKEIEDRYACCSLKEANEDSPPLIL